MQLRSILVLGTLALAATCGTEATIMMRQAKDESGSASSSVGASTDGSAAATSTDGSSAVEVDNSPCPNPDSDKEAFIKCVKRKAKQPAPKEWVEDNGKNAPWNNFGKCPDQQKDSKAYDKCMAEFWKKNGEPIDKQCSDFTKGGIEFNICSSELLANDLVETSSSGSEDTSKSVGDDDEDNNKLDNFDPKKDEKKTDNPVGSQSAAVSIKSSGLAAAITMVTVAVLNRQ